MSRAIPIITKEETAEFTRKFKIFLILSISLFLFSAIVVMIVKHYNMSDALVYTLEALSFLLHDETGFMKGYQIFMATFGGFLIWWILWSLFDIIFESDFEEYINELRIRKRLKKMKNHVIIVGGGKVGDELANRLALEKKQITIIEKDPARTKILKKEGFTVIQVTTNEADALKKAKIKDAKFLVIASPETERNLLIMLVAKELNSKIEIFVRGDNPEVVNILEKAGAKKIVIPELAAVDQFMIDLDAAEKEHKNREEKAISVLTK